VAANKKTKKEIIRAVIIPGREYRTEAGKGKNRVRKCFVLIIWEIKEVN